MQAEDEGDEVAKATPVWQPAVDRVRQSLAADDDAALIALDDELRALLGRPRPQIRRAIPQLQLYRSLIVWKRDARFDAPFDDAQTAKIQFWDLDEHCSDLEYKRVFADHAVVRYPNRRGFRLFQRIIKTIASSDSRFIVDGTDVQVHRRAGATMTIVGFAAMKGGLAGIGWDLFDRAVVAPLNANLVMLQDFNERLYLAGIESLGDYDQSVARLREILTEFADTKIVATGASAGVFGALYYSAKLGIRHVVALAGPTSLEVGEDNPDRQIYRRIGEDIDAGRLHRVDVIDKVINSAIERVDFFVAGQHRFDMAQFEAMRSRCDKIEPHIYAGLNDLVVTDYAIEDGSIFEAFRAGPQASGLAPPPAA